MLRPASVLQSDYLLAGRPLSPSKDWRPGFSIGLVPILTGQAQKVPDDVSIPSSAPPGPYGPARCRLSRRRELRIDGSLGSSSKKHRGRAKWLRIRENAHLAYWQDSAPLLYLVSTSTTKANPPQGGDAKPTDLPFRGRRPGRRKGVLLRKSLRRPDSRAERVYSLVLGVLDDLPRRSGSAEHYPAHLRGVLSKLRPHVETQLAALETLARIIHEAEFR
jgi:hypothetical protein